MLYFSYTLWYIQSTLVFFPDFLGGLCGHEKSLKLCLGGGDFFADAGYKGREIGDFIFFLHSIAHIEHSSIFSRFFRRSMRA
jgi:hypothetical protein